MCFFLLYRTFFRFYLPYVFCYFLCSSYVSVCFFLLVLCWVLLLNILRFPFNFVGSLLCIICVFFLHMYMALSLLFVCKYTSHCNLMETPLQLINIIS
jgi:hypothetical protein